jgi:AcrR family transcriptional regulator
MPSGVARKRTYRAPRREQQAARTRQSLILAARRLFVEQGYGATSVADIAAEAHVNVATLYAAVGRKAVLMRAVIEGALTGSDDPLPAAQADYVERIFEARGARQKLRIYAEAAVAIQQRLAPVLLCLWEAAKTDVECRGLWSEIAERRSRNMRDFAAELRRTGAVRADLTDSEVADIIWSLNGPEHYALLVGERHWPADRFASWLAEAWARLLLR